MPQQLGPDIENQILAALPEEEYERLLPKLEKVHMEFHQTVCEPDQPIEHIYFPLNSVVSLLSLMENGETAEVGIVGYEGIVGLPVFLDADSTTNLAITQIEGEGMKMKAADFKEEANRQGSLQTLLKRYTQARLMQVSQSAACNRFHSVEERFCRWILMNHDRARKDEFVMTQEFASQMLGVRRPTVSVVASMLQKAGLIRYRRGNMTILDREGLEAGCCECYQIVRKDFEQLLGSNLRNKMGQN
ncbi:Crp/Fnr family transcriptional regulator [Pseudanabaena sp. FACHB-2040]|uniref:Crp/Fnr family transcriptional regulator n=1 Tax=Pseudanabaena sp. FACHB-2040 TaxID=2692859 RepID=UPI001686BD47|nr:Crp/Fnr family transcriptional regulator [Pseudanabaena sp. FACHB-2040]MBD2257405.1 Crp/Fnr family transcriptional regulator [Pseudanabaena sp. FACHB-2040]